MIDAFKPDYLEHAPYLMSLTKKNQWGELDMGLGHWRGVEVLFQGKSEVIAIFYKNKNSLSYFKYFKENEDMYLLFQFIYGKQVRPKGGVFLYFDELCA